MCTIIVFSLQKYTLQKIQTLQKYIPEKIKVPLFEFVRDQWEQVVLYTHMCFFFTMHIHICVYKFHKFMHILYIVLKLAFFPLYILDLFPISIYRSSYSFLNLPLAYDICIEACTSCKLAAQWIITMWTYLCNQQWGQEIEYYKCPKAAHGDPTSFF